MTPDTPILAVALDLDGLMFDTEALFVRVAVEMLADRDKVFTPEMMRAMIGRQAAVAYPAFKALAGLDESEEGLRDEVRERMSNLLDTAVHPTPGLFMLLDQLKAKKLPVAVATSSRRVYAERLLRNHRIWDRLAFVLTAEDVARSKPDPEIYLSAAARFGIRAGALLVLEDSPAGIASARGAGAFAVAVPHEHSPAEHLGDANLVVPRLDDSRLLALLGSAD